MKHVGAVLIGCLLLASAPAARQQAGDAGRVANSAPANVRLLAAWMIGTFDTAAQADADKAAGAAYVHDRVRVKVAGPLDIGAVDRDGMYLYLEQAQLDALEKPYRQRVFRLFARDGTIVAEIWKLADPARFAGAWADPARLRQIRLEDLRHEPGCDLAFVREGDVFRGETAGKSCASTWNGSAYVRSSVTVSADGQTSLDRGFDAQDRQTFGPRNGEAYQFRRISK